MAHIEGYYNDVRESPLEAGIRQYYEAKDRADAKKRQQQELQMGLLSHGLIQDANGNISRDPTQERIREAQNQAALDEPQLGLLKAGVVRNPDGTLVRDPLEQAKLQAQTQELQGRGALYRAGATQKAGVPGGANTAQTKDFTDTAKQLEMMRGNPAVQQAEKDLYSVQKLKSLGNGDLNKLSPQMASLYAQEVAKMAQGGVPTTSEMQGLLPHAIPASLAAAAQTFTNSPQPANLGGFIKQFQDYGNSIEHDAQGVVTDRYGRILGVHKIHLAPTDYQSLQDQYINRFQKSAPSGGAILDNPDAHNAALNEANRRLQVNPNDPVALKAKQIATQKLGSLPGQAARSPQSIPDQGGMDQQGLIQGALMNGGGANGY